MKRLFLIVSLILSTVCMTLFTYCSYSNDDEQVLHPEIEEPEPDPVPEPLPAEYYAALSNSNAFIVKPGESVTFPVMKAFAVWKQYKEVIKSELSREATLQVTLVWQDQPALVSEVNLSKKAKEYSEITVKTARKKGNAVVALKSDDKICWSWHLWVTDYDPENQINGRTYQWDNNEDGISDYVWMDRNLGAETNGNKLTKEDSLAASGLFYQWGRKDPLPGDRTFRYTTENYPPNFDSHPIYNMMGKILRETGSETGEGVYTLKTNEDRGTANLLKSIMNPMIYLKGIDVPYDDWFASELLDPDDTLWDWNGKKGIFDPCPDGWRVPAYKNGSQPWQGFDEANSPYSQLGVFPCAGFRYLYNNGALKNSGFQSCIYCAVVNKKANARYLNIHKDYLGATKPKIDVTSRSTAMSVRCVRNND